MATVSSSAILNHSNSCIHYATLVTLVCLECRDTCLVFAVVCSSSGRIAPIKRRYIVTRTQSEACVVNVSFLLAACCYAPSNDAHRSSPLFAVLQKLLQIEKGLTHGIIDTCGAVVISFHDSAHLLQKNFVFSINFHVGFIVHAILSRLGMADPYSLTLRVMWNTPVIVNCPFHLKDTEL